MRNPLALRGALVIAFFLIGYLPKTVLLLADSFIVRIALLIAILVLVGTDPVSALFALIVVARLYVERNQYKIQQIQNVMSQSTPDSPVFVPESEAQLTQHISNFPPPVQPQFETPITKPIPFAPGAETGENLFSPVAPSQDHKVPNPTSPSDGHDKVIAKLFTWVKPELAQNEV